MESIAQELRGNVRVFCRVRPMPSRAGEAAAATFCMPDATSLRLDDAKSGASHTFTYDRVFDAHSAQADVFAEVSQLVQSALDGYKVCLFSYGQTGAGKTHTMLGCGSGEQRGIIPRAVEKVRRAIQQPSLTRNPSSIDSSSCADGRRHDKGESRGRCDVRGGSFVWSG